MNADLARLRHTPYRGYLTVENVDAVASRLHEMLFGKRFTLVRSIPGATRARPSVRTSCTTTGVSARSEGVQGLLQVTFGDGRCLSFVTSAADQGDAQQQKKVNRTRIEFTPGHFTVTTNAADGGVHYTVIAVENEPVSPAAAASIAADAGTAAPISSLRAAGAW
ncbi:hypothetical protein ACQEVF_58025 [Nonomuraea polychroma]|uniref:hypothetical protein n=1 Tax=Nonomuraea polychroma TaxID=46176 RepID=UPI003D8D5B5A